MNIYETFDNLRYYHENEVVEFKKAENSFDFDDGVVVKYVKFGDVSARIK